MVIIALMTGFAIPGLRNSLFTDQLKKTTRKILGVISEASQEAVSRHTEYSLYFDLDKNTISSTSTELSAPEAEKDSGYLNYELPESVRLVDVESAHNGRLAQGSVPVRFSKKGYVDKTLLHLRTEDGDEMTILISPFLGVTKVFDSYIDLEDDRVRY